MLRRAPLLPVNLTGDLAAFVGSAIVALVIGVGIDLLARSRPLGLVYRKPLDGLVSAANVSGSETASGTISIVSSEEVKELLGHRDIVILDAQDHAFFELGHLPGALSLPPETFERDFRSLENELRTPGKSLLVYCSDADCENSAIVAQRLYDRGFRRLLVFKGGIKEWQEAGLPVVPAE